MPRETIVDAAARLLLTHRTRTTKQIATHVRRKGLSWAADPEASVRRRLEEDERFHRATGDRWILVEELVVVRATHRLTPQEVTSGTLGLGVDLGHLAATAAAHELLLPDGMELQLLHGALAERATGVECGIALRGPAGWLGHGAGSLVEVTAVGGTLHVEAADPPSAEARLRARRLVARAGQLLESMPSGAFGEPFIATGDVLLDLLADDTGFAEVPLPPFGDLFEGTDLEVHRAYIGRAGRDWSELDRFLSVARKYVRRFAQAEEADGWDDDSDRFDSLDDDDLDDEGPAAASSDEEVPGFDDETIDMLAATVGLDADEKQTLGLILDLFVVWQVPGRDGTVPGESPTMRRNLAELASHEPVAAALAEYAWLDPAFEAFAADLRAGARGLGIAGTECLLGASAEARGALDEAERHHRAAVVADPGFLLAHWSLHRFDLDRGDYPAALAHLRAAGAPADDPQRTWLESIVAPAYPSVGRNEPCPCGSGRKFKVCHLGRPATQAPEPGPALFRKLDMWTDQPDVRRAMVALVEEVVAASRGEPGGASRDEHSGRSSRARPDAARLGRRAVSAPHAADAIETVERLMGEHVALTADVLMFDRGWLDRLLAVRGSLLPPAERALVETWRSTHRGLYEVVAVRPGEGVTMRDLAAGTGPVEVADRTISRIAAPLDLYVMRVRPDGAGRMLASDGFVVPRSSRAFVTRLVRSGDEIAFLRWISEPPPAPRLQNTEGEPFLLTTLTFRLVDPDGARRQLAGVLEEDEDGLFRESAVSRMGRVQRGTIRIVGDTATIEANSKKRADRLSRTLRDADPGAVEVGREEIDALEAMKDLDMAALAGKGLRAEDAVGPSPGTSRAGVGKGSDPVPMGRLDPVEHPEVREALDRVMRDFERRWVDEHIPALGGRTPREALRSPAGRREVLALLDDMEWQNARHEADGRSGADPVGTMDPDRIRALLGLRSSRRESDGPRTGSPD